MCILSEAANAINSPTLTVYPEYESRFSADSWAIAHSAAFPIHIPGSVSHGEKKKSLIQHSLISFVQLRYHFTCIIWTLPPKPYCESLPVSWQAKFPSLSTIRLFPKPRLAELQIPWVSVACYGDIPECGAQPTLDILSSSHGSLLPT